MNQANQLILETLRFHGLNEPPATSLRDHLTQRWRKAILDGRLPAQAPLPSTRVLAAELGIGRSTIVEIIEQMALEGYVITRPGGATRVAKLSKLPVAAQPRRALPEVSSDLWRLDDPPTPVVHRAFRPGLPDLHSLSSSGWAAHLARRARRPISHDLSYAHATGLPALQQALLAHLRLTRGVQAEPHQVIIVPSAQAAFDIATRAAIRSGDTAWVEDPCYPGIRTVLRGAGAKLVPCPVDAQGMKPRALGKTHPKLIYLTPSHQYPTGVMMALERRLQLLDLAHRSGALIIEDDYDSEYQVRGQPVASLQGLDRKQCVAYVGTFSKTLAPGLRAAFLVMPPRYSTLAHTLAMACGQLVSAPLQLALADFLNEGGLQRHIRKLTTETSQRMTLLVQSLRALREPRLHIPEPLGSLQICVGWSGQTRDTELVSRLNTHAISAAAISPLCLDTQKQGLLLGVGLVSLDEIEPAVRRMAKCLAQVR
ncbi:MAG: PLP-dependent aminotransferase family protein [Burkholderiales bacterium]|nr:MAG: PLP-dependent aminotransferase family protein [Burkholderiales bacterium]